MGKFMFSGIPGTVEAREFGVWVRWGSTGFWLSDYSARGGLRDAINRALKGA